MIEISNLSKYYKKNIALNDITANIPKGVYGLIGENGAGKTTLLKILATLENYQSGEVRFMKNNLKSESDKIRPLIGYLPQKFVFFPNMTVYEAMRYMSVLKGIAKENQDEDIILWLKSVNLLKERDKKIKNLSGGMLQRFGIAQAFLGNPKLVILDEPTVGLDPKERLSFRNLVNQISDDKTIIISTHIINDISSTCEFLGVLKQGNLMYEGTVKSFTQSVEHKIYTVILHRKEMQKVINTVNVISIKRNGQDVELRFIAENADKIIGFGNVIEESCTIEDAYFYYTKQWLKEEGSV